MTVRGSPAARSAHRCGGLERFAGRVAVVSYDRWFLDHIGIHVLAFEGHSEVAFLAGGSGSFDDSLPANPGDATTRPRGTTDCKPTR